MSHLLRDKPCNYNACAFDVEFCNQIVYKKEDNGHWF